MSDSYCKHCRAHGPQHQDDCPLRFVAPGPRPDPEIEALGACIRALLPLPPDAIRRVLEYLEGRFNAPRVPE